MLIPYHEQFFIGKIPVWIAMHDGKALHESKHPKKYLFPKVIQNKLHADQLLDHFSIISIDLVEDYRYQVFTGKGIAVGSMLYRHYEHKRINPPPFPRSILDGNLFVYYCDAEAALQSLRAHFKFIVDNYPKRTQEVRQQTSNIAHNVWIDEKEVSHLRIGLNEKKRRRSSLSDFLASSEEDD